MIFRRTALLGRDPGASAIPVLDDLVMTRRRISYVWLE